MTLTIKKRGYWCLRVVYTLCQGLESDGRNFLAAIVLTVHYGVEEITVNARKMLKKFYWTYLLIWRFLKCHLTGQLF
jgi:hypothetical protein